MLVAVGTTNAAKLSAVAQALAAMFPAALTDVRGVAVASGVSDQPMSEAETIAGATNRARRALAAVAGADFGIGIEGGIQRIGDAYFDGGWVAVVDKTGRLGLGCSARYEIPRGIMARVLAGDELGVVMDAVTGGTDVKQGAGAMGILTAGVVNRDVCYIHGICFAFSRWTADAKYWA